MNAGGLSRPRWGSAHRSVSSPVVPDRRLSGIPLDFDVVRRALAVPDDFPPAALAEARDAAGAALPDVEDRTALPLVTVDPPGAKDLDQAVHIAESAEGFVVSYAIADVARCVRPGGSLDAVTRERGETLYFPDMRVPLHPLVLSEGAASLLPGEVRAAALWEISLDRTGEVSAASVRRALVRSVAQLDYGQLQAMIDGGTAPEAVRLLSVVGRLRQGLARARHAIELDLPAQEVEPTGDATSWRLAYRSPLPVEQWNAEISLLTGMSAARMMLDHGIGILRTLPAPDPRAVSGLRRIAPALGVVWPAGAPAGDVLATLDRDNPRHVAFLDQAASLLRGAGYTAFDGKDPAQSGHAGVGADYAHVTAPLRRLVDRFGTEVCLALSAGAAVPDWVRRALPELPALMEAADHRAHTVDRAVLDTVEAWLLQDRVGAVFTAVVLDQGKDSARISIEEPAIRASCTGSGLREGSVLQVRLTVADLATRTVRFEPA